MCASNYKHQATEGEVGFPNKRGGKRKELLLDKPQK